jgi:hypothetical protein
MSLGDDLDKMSLKDSAKDPVEKAARKGKAPTLKDVKKSVKVSKIIVEQLPSK